MTCSSKSVHEYVINGGNVTDGFRCDVIACLMRYLAAKSANLSPSECIRASNNPKSPSAESSHNQSVLLDIAEISGVPFVLAATRGNDSIMSYHIIKCIGSEISSVTTIPYHPTYTDDTQINNVRLELTPDGSAYVMFNDAVVITCQNDVRPLDCYFGKFYGCGMTDGDESLCCIGDQFVISVWQRPSLSNVPEQQSAELNTGVLMDAFSLYTSGRAEAAKSQALPFLVVTKSSPSDDVADAVLMLSDRVIDSIPNYDPRWAEEENDDMDTSVSIAEDDDTFGIRPPVPIAKQSAAARPAKSPGRPSASDSVGSALVKEHLLNKIVTHSKLIEFVTGMGMLFSLFSLFIFRHLG